MFYLILKSLYRRRLLIGATCLALKAVFAEPATAQEEQALVQADKMAYSQKANVIVAKGNVEVAQGEQVLHADQIVYDLTKDVVRAEGNVSVLQPSGEVIFADHAEITGDMKQGFVEKVRVLFPDNSRLAAQDAQRYEGRYLVADRGVYSACNLCKDDPERPPLWQMKAARITHDSEEKQVIYRDATLEMEGVPFFYLPYFSHPDPTVRRRQGFLSPSGGFNQYLGAFVRTPYYFDIAPNDDAVVMPVFSQEDKLQLSAQWRHRFARGSMQWDGSFTRADLVDEFGADLGQQWRGHLFGNSLFNMSREWRAGTDVAFSSDKSYLRRYNITSNDVLLNRGFVEGFSGRDYAVGNVYYFQDLRPGARPSEPLVAPELRYSAFGEPGKTLGGRWALDAGTLVTTRKRDVNPSKQGPDTRRIDFGAGWERQFVSSTGFLTTIGGQARLDGYWAGNMPDPEKPIGTGFSDVFDIRQFAQADVTVRYPLGRRGDGYQQILEPIALLSLAPNMSNREQLPNEDSLDVEFDETNLFSKNRFTGIDRIEGGIRAAYGLRHALIGDNGARIDILGGQLFRIKRNENFPDGSGLEDQFSDYVGRVEFSPAEWLNAIYGFRLDKDTLKFQRQEAQASVGVPYFRPFVNYLTVNQTQATTGIAEHIEEATAGFTSTFAKYYKLTASHSHAFLPDAGPRTSSLSLSYQDECFQIGITGSRDKTNREDIESGTSVMFHFYLKNIGGVHTDSVDSGTFQTPALKPSTP